MTTSTTKAWTRNEALYNDASVDGVFFKKVFGFNVSLLDTSENGLNFRGKAWHSSAPEVCVREMDGTVVEDLRDRAVIIKDLLSGEAVDYFVGPVIILDDRYLDPSKCVGNNADCNVERHWTAVQWNFYGTDSAGGAVHVPVTSLGSRAILAAAIKSRGFHFPRHDALGQRKNISTGIFLPFQPLITVEGITDGKKPGLKASIGERKRDSRW